MVWAAVAALIYALWGLRPRKPLRDVVELEAFKVLRKMQHQERNADYYEKKISRHANFGSLAVLLFFAYVGEVNQWPIGFSLTLGIAGACGCRWLVMKATHRFRNVVMPLYLTLCHVQNAQWDTNSPPRRWVRIPRNPSSTRPVRLKLPKDWHASKLALKAIAEIVAQRLGNEWRMETDTRRFEIRFYPRVMNVVSLHDVMADSEPVMGVEADSEDPTIEISIEKDPEMEGGLDAW